MKKLAAIILMSIIGVAQAGLDIEVWKTPEGSEVLYSQTKGLPMVDIQVNFNAASSKDGEHHGLANLTNGLIGMGTRWKNETEIINEIKEIGAEFGQNSLKDMAIFSLRTISDEAYLTKAVDLFAEVIGEPDFDTDSIRKEKSRIIRGIDYDKDSVGAIAKKRFGQELFESHAYAHSKTGTEGTIGKISGREIRAFYNKYYVAKNMNIAIVGDISKSRAKQIARKISHKLNPGKKAENGADVKELIKSKVVDIKYPSKQTHIFIGKAGIKRSNPNYYSFFLGNHILGGSGLTSVLSQEVREKKGLVYSVASQMGVMAQKGYFLINLQTRNEKVKDATALVKKTLEEWVENGVTQDELDGAKNNIIGGWSLGVSTNSDIVSYLSIMGFYDLDRNWLDNYINRIREVSKEDIKNTFQEFIDVDKLLIVRVGGGVG